MSQFAVSEEIRHSCEEVYIMTRARRTAVHSWFLFCLLMLGFLALTSNGSGAPGGPSVARIAAVQTVPGAAMDDVLGLVTRAGQGDADIVLLPMDFVTHLPQPVTGPIYSSLAPLADMYDMYVVAPISEASGDHVFNSAIVIDPTGEIAGVYRQAHVSPEDRLAGVTAGDDLPVFDTSFGRIGVLLGYDLVFREAPRVLALRGANLLLYAFRDASTDETQPVTRLREAITYDGYAVAMAGRVPALSTEWASMVFSATGEPRTWPCFGPCVVSAAVDMKPDWSGWANSREQYFACRDPYAFSELVREGPRPVDQSPRTVKVACIQSKDLGWDHVQQVLVRAGELGADVVVAQEVYLPNPENLPISATNSVVLNRVKQIANDYDMTIVAGMSLGIEGHANMCRSSMVIVTPTGEIATPIGGSGPRPHYQHTGYPADDFDVYDTGFGPFGVSVCWDLMTIGPESVRIQMLKGARIVFFGTLVIPDDLREVIMRSFAMGSVIPIAYAAHESDSSGPDAGVVGADGAPLPSTIDEGISGFGDELFITDVELALPPDLLTRRQQLLLDRRPTLYTPLVQSDICLARHEVLLDPPLSDPGRLSAITAVTYNALVPMIATYEVRFLVDDVAVCSNTVAYERWRSPPSGSWDFAYRWLCSGFNWLAEPGPHTLSIVADPNNEIAELREDNNRVDLVVDIPFGVPTSTPTPPMIPAPGGYPVLPTPWEYLGYAFDEKLDGKIQTNFCLDRLEIYADAPGAELINTGHHVGTHIAVQYRDTAGEWHWRPGLYPDLEGMPDYPPVADAFSACYFIEDPDIPGAYVVGYQRSDPAGTHALFYMSPREVAGVWDQPFDGHALLTARCGDGVCGDSICAGGMWAHPAFIRVGEKTCLLALPTGHREGFDSTGTPPSTYPVILEHDPDETWADVPANRYQYVWRQSGAWWKPLRWNAEEILGATGPDPGAQVQAACFSHGERTYVLVVGGATLNAADGDHPSRRGFMYLYKFLSGSAPGPDMDYRAELVQTIVDPRNALPGSPAMVGGFISGAIRPLPIRLQAGLPEVPCYVCPVVRREETDTSRWRMDFGEGMRDVAGGFVILRGYLEGGEPRFALEPPIPCNPESPCDYVSGYGIAVLPGSEGDEVLFKTGLPTSNGFLVMRVPNERGRFDLRHATTVLDQNDIIPGSSWKPYWFSACFLGLLASEEAGGGYDLVVPLSLEEILDPPGPEHLRHTFLIYRDIDRLPAPR